MTWPGRGRESAIVANKLRKKRPLRTDGAYLRQCFGVGADNILVRLTRPIEHFSLFEKPRAAQAEYNNRFAGRPAGSTEKIGKAGSRMRVNLDGHLIYLDLVFKALGTTPALGHAIPSGVEAMGDGPLAARIIEAVRDQGSSLKEFTVLTGVHDPYRFDTPRKRRDAEWFVEHWRKYRGVKHIRGLHYKLIGGTTKPNGHRYVGDFANFTWLQTASAAARWLGLIPFDEFEDRRSGDPFTYRAERDPTPLAVGAASRFGAEPPTIDIFDGEEGELSLYPTIVGMKAEQRFLLAIFGEKSSIRGEAEPLAMELGADLYLETGEQSATHVYHIAQRADADGRDLVVLCVTDCDPSGYQMAVSIARKLQALIDLYFPALNATVIHIGLTPAQVRQYRLPSSPLSRKELRRTRWRERMGVEQTEIDALLTRHPGALTAMMREALKPYYDPTLNSRVRRAEREWQAGAETTIEEQIADDPDLSGPMERAEEQASEVTARIEALNTRIEQIRDLVAEVNDEAEFDQ